jgi:hypothetical protein
MIGVGVRTDLTIGRGVLGQSELPNLRNFAWQHGYGAFSVGISQVRSITSSSDSNIIGHEPFKKSI